MASWLLREDSKVARISERWIRRILAVLYERRGATRAEIVRATRLNVASVSLAVRYLLARGVIQRGGTLQTSAGRKPEHLQLNPEAGFFLALDLEGTRIRFALTNFLGDVRHRWEVPFARDGYLDISTLAQGLDAVRASLEPCHRSRVIALGVCYTGIMDRWGRVTAVNLGWDRFPLREQLQRVVDVPVYFGSESLVKLTAERWLGRARGRNHCVFINVANGVGCAVWNEGRPILGRDGAAGELGHTLIDPSAPDRCGCGQRGCLEAIVSSPSLVRQYWERTGRRREQIYGEEAVGIFEKARNGDSVAIEVVERAAHYLGLAVANIANLLNPELIILGGDIAYGSDLLLPRIREIVGQRVLPALRASLQVEVSALGLDIGLIGAASLAFHAALREPALLKRICSASSAEMS